jgi:glycosyltransferase involved in cell wall biosynthesis
MKKTLLICGHYPIPENIGANIRTMNFVRFFKEYGTIDIAYSYTLPGAQVGNPIFSNEYYLARESVKSFKERLRRWVDIRNRPLPVSKYEDASEKKLLSLIESNDYDYIIVRYLMNTWSLFQLPAKYKRRAIIDYDDVVSGSLYESNIASANGSFRKFRLRLNQKCLKNYEKKCFTFGASLFCSEEDRAKLVGENGKENIFVVPNIYHNSSFNDYDFGDGFLNKNILLFVGTLHYKPNIDGLKWFIESIFPDFKSKFQDAKLLVVGRSPGPDVRNLCGNNADIELYADASDIKEYYKKCKAVIVPILAGGGTRIKILEAALANRPILSTPIGAEGLSFVNQKDLLLFENASGFSAQYIKLLDRDTYNALVRNAKQVVLTQYSTQRFNDAMGEVIDKLAYRKWKRTKS